MLEEVHNIENVFEKLQDYLAFDDIELTLVNLRNQLIEFDTRRDGTVDNDDFKWGLKIFKLALTPQEMDIIYSHYSQNERVKIHEFLSRLSQPKESIERLIQSTY